MLIRILLLTIFLAANTASAAGFDCTKARSKVEISICTNPTLSALDEELSRMYKKVLRYDEHIEQKKKQRKWLSERNLCVDQECIQGLYLTRVKELNLLLVQSRPYGTCTHKDGRILFLLCSNAELSNLNENHNVMFFRIFENATAEEIYILLTAKNSYARKIHGCASRISEHSLESDSIIMSCLHDVLQQEGDFLEKSAVDHSTILAGVSQFTQIDVDFLVMYKTELIGQSKEVMGWLELLDPPSKQRGVLHSNNNPNLTMPVIFKRLSADDVSFIKQNNPYSSHKGEVIEHNGEVVLYLEELLGRPL